MADNYRTNKAYELLLKQRQKNIDKNLAQGRSMQMSGIPLNESIATPANTLSDVLSDIKENKGLVQNLEDTVKTTSPDMIGIAPEIAYKSKFPSIARSLDTVKNVGTTINEDIPDKKGILSLLKNSGGFSKVLPALGMGATALAGLSIANKVQAGELGDAGLEGADLATDYIPGVGQAKMALRPSELGNSELPPEVMEERRKFNVLSRLK